MGKNRFLTADPPMKLPYPRSLFLTTFLIASFDYPTKTWVIVILRELDWYTRRNDRTPFFKGDPG